MKKVLSFLILMLLPMVVGAETVEIGGIYYNLINERDVAEVTGDLKNKYSGSVVIPPSVVYLGTTYNVRGIGDSAFEGCSNLFSVTIPNSVTNIGQSAFSGCSSLNSITIPNSVISIGSRAF